MATLPKMIEALSKLDNRPKPAVQQFGRAIREAGHIPKGKRGAGAPELTANDIASLLLGTYGSEAQSKAPEAVTKYRRLIMKGIDPCVEIKKHEGIDQGKYASSTLVKRMNTAANFGEIIEWLIENADQLALELLHLTGESPTSNVKKDETEFDRAQRLSTHALHITLSSSYAEVTLMDMFNRVHLYANFQTPDGLLDEFRQEWSADRHTQVTFTQRTFYALHEAMKQ